MRDGLYASIYGTAMYRGLKAVEKRSGGGAHNWGNITDAVKYVYISCLCSHLCHFVSLLLQVVAVVRESCQRKSGFWVNAERTLYGRHRLSLIRFLVTV